jgi:hypothetical protein
LCGIVAIIIYYWKKYNKDVILLIDKSNRFLLYYVDIGGSKNVKIGEHAYFFNEDCAKLNTRGKALYIFSQGKPTPLKIDYNKHAWLDSDTLLPVINNELVKQIVKPTDPAKEMMILLGAIGGVVAGIASIVILLIQLGIVGGG